MMLKKTRSIALMLVLTTSTTVGVSRMYVGGYEVRAEGRVIGYVDSIEDVKKIASEFDTEIYEGYGIENSISDKLSITKKIDLKDNITDKSQLKKNISSLSGLITEGYILVINDEKTIAFDSLQEMYKTLNALKDMYKIDNFQADFCEKVEYVADYINNTEIYNSEKALQYLKENKLLSVKCQVETTYKGAVNFDTVKKEDNTMYQGSIKIEKEGETGENLITASVLYVNGEEVSREIIKEEVIKEPVSQIEITGTKEAPKGYGSFISPVSGKLTSEFGQRWGRLHGGVDLAAPEGTPIKASDNGTVVFADYSGSYGLLVKVDHKNGYITYYAHCSKINVNVGDSVLKGNTIALVGNTGNSTGPHCHFEIRYNNEPIDPMKFIN